MSQEIKQRIAHALYPLVGEKVTDNLRNRAFGLLIREGLEPEYVNFGPCPDGNLTKAIMLVKLMRDPKEYRVG